MWERLTANGHDVGANSGHAFRRSTAGALYVVSPSSFLLVLVSGVCVGGGGGGGGSDDDDGDGERREKLRDSAQAVGANIPGTCVPWNDTVDPTSRRSCRSSSRWRRMS